LARALGVSVPATIGHLHLLWWWALDYAPDGDLSNSDTGDVAAACLWDGDPAALSAALLRCGFVDADNTIHDWYEYAGRLLERRDRVREQTRQRVQHWRERHQDTSSLQEASNANVTRYKRVSNAPVTLSNAPTGPNRTGPNRTAVSREAAVLDADASEGTTASDGDLQNFHETLSGFGKQGYAVDAAQLRKLGTRYPLLDLPIEAEKIAEWLREPRHRQKRCSYRFLVNWLDKAEADRLARLDERAAADAARRAQGNGRAPPEVDRYVPIRVPDRPDLVPPTDAERQRFHQTMRAAAEKLGKKFTA
jgi:hypothetical protein